MWLLILLGAGLPALDVGLKFTPTLAGYMPHFMDTDIWRLAPLLFLLGAATLYVWRNGRQVASIKLDEAKSLLPPRQFPKVQYMPESDFALLPLHFRVDASAQIPTVEVRFYVVNYLSRPILLSEVNLSLQVSGLPSLEDIPLRQKDFRVEPREHVVVTLSRQLTNAERELGWKNGRVPSASFALLARATDGAQSFAFGPVSSMVIEGWISAGFRMPGT